MESSIANIAAEDNTENNADIANVSDLKQTQLEKTIDALVEKRKALKSQRKEMRIE